MAKSSADVTVHIRGVFWFKAWLIALDQRWVWALVGALAATVAIFALWGVPR